MIIDGKQIANELCDSIATQVKLAVESTGRTPGLAVVLVQMGDPPALPGRHA